MFIVAQNIEGKGVKKRPDTDMYQGQSDCIFFSGRNNDEKYFDILNLKRNFT